MTTAGAKMMKVEHILGLDLGQSADPSALAVLRKTSEVATGRHGFDVYGPANYVVNHLVRWPLGTSYPKIVEDVGELLRRPQLRPAPPPEGPRNVYYGDDGSATEPRGDGSSAPLRRRYPIRTRLCVDATGVGRAVVDLLIDAKPKLACRIVPITITSGERHRRDGWPGTPEGGFWVGKRELVSVVQATLQTERLKVARGLPLAETLKGEMLNFQVKVSAAANESFNAREGQHDDILLAVAIALWTADRNDPPIRFIPLCEPEKLRPTGRIPLTPGRPGHPMHGRIRTADRGVHPVMAERPRTKLSYIGITLLGLGCLSALALRTAWGPRQTGGRPSARDDGARRASRQPIQNLLMNQILINPLSESVRSSASRRAIPTAASSWQPATATRIGMPSSTPRTGAASMGSPN